MADDRRHEDFVYGSEINDMDRSDEEVFNEITVGANSSEEVQSSYAGSTAHTRGNVQGGGLAASRSIGLAVRLAEILVNQGDGDLLLQQSERDYDFLQWIHALDMQVMGACRADERLKPLLKTNISSGATEDWILARLSQHFDAAEIGQLARCLCIPLVSIRAGKVIKERTTLYPTSSRGNLIVALLPSSDLRVSFVGDDGEIERIATLSRIPECSTLTIEEIPDDKSGKSFLIRTAGIEIFYFWCAEKSNLLGNELISKMKGLLRRKPTLASLTGISELRLERLVIELRVCLMGSNIFKPSSSSAEASNDIARCSQFSSSTKSPISQHCSSVQQQLGSLSPPQGSPSPYINSSQISFPRSHEDCNIHTSSLTTSLIVDAITSDNCKENSSENYPASTLSFFEFLANDSLPPLSIASQKATVGVGVGVGVGSLLSPYYCWCPPCPSLSTPLSAQLPFATSVESFTSLLPMAAFPTLLPQIPPLNVGTTVPSLSLPSSLFSSRCPNQFSTFTPLMCDSIVHVPVIDVCSGPGYLVSAGPSALTSIIPPLVMTTPESVVDKGARETLRLLISGSSQPNPTFMGIVPSSALTDDDNVVLLAGSRGMCGGMSGVSAIEAVGLASMLSDSNIYSNGSEVKAGDGKGKFGFDTEDRGTFSSTGNELND